jgi:phosphatidate phosphatase LPIN
MPTQFIRPKEREVIRVMRKPEMACLRDIRNLFRNPFYAGFGNRITDASSYRGVKVPSSRTFTLGSSGEVKLDLVGISGVQVLVRVLLLDFVSAGISI